MHSLGIYVLSFSVSPPLSSRMASGQKGRRVCIGGKKNPILFYHPLPVFLFLYFGPSYMLGTYMYLYTRPINDPRQRTRVEESVEKKNPHKTKKKGSYCTNQDVHKFNYFFSGFQYLARTGSWYRSWLIFRSHVILQRNQTRSVCRTVGLSPLHSDTAMVITP